uniref:hypothetical protein n=1 Tax=Paenibacillus polymyxa TaxID=1406 RepID=UPI001C715A1A
ATGAEELEATPTMAVAALHMYEKRARNVALPLSKSLIYAIQIPYSVQTYRLPITVVRGLTT